MAIIDRNLMRAQDRIGKAVLVLESHKMFIEANILQECVHAKKIYKTSVSIGKILAALWCLVS
jgi:hypothetical protein